MKFKANKDAKVRIILTALYNEKEMIQHPLGRGAKKDYNRYMSQPMERVDEQWELAKTIINQNIAKGFYKS